MKVWYLGFPFTVVSYIFTVGTCYPFKEQPAGPDLRQVRRTHGVATEATKQPTGRRKTPSIISRVRLESYRSPRQHVARRTLGADFWVFSFFRKEWFCFVSFLSGGRVVYLYIFLLIYLYVNIYIYTALIWKIEVDRFWSQKKSQDFSSPSTVHGHDTPTWISSLFCFFCRKTLGSFLQKPEGWNFRSPTTGKLSRGNMGGSGNFRQHKKKNLSNKKKMHHWDVHGT